VFPIFASMQRYTEALTLNPVPGERPASGRALSLHARWHGMVAHTRQACMILGQSYRLCLGRKLIIHSMKRPSILPLQRC